MDNSVYIALSRQLSLFRDMDITANNIANTNTTGYNAERILFNDYLTKDINQGSVNPMSFASNPYSYRDTSQGTIRATGNELDVAIMGDGYFTVQTPLGTRYTRDGSFQRDGGGTLITSEGYPVLDISGQQITIPEDALKIEIGEAGNMKVNGEDFSTIAMVEFENPRLLERLDGKLFKTDITPQPATNSRMTQGMLENANVQPVLEMTHMLKISNKVSGTAKLVEVVYDLQRKAASTWAKQG